jgi:hypothetical protein
MVRTDGIARVAAGAWLAAIGGGLVLGAVGGAPARAVAEGGPGCPLRMATGLPCPFCGMTHAVLAMGGGDVRAALAFHPVAPLVIVLVVVLCAAAAAGRIDAVTRGRRGAAMLAALAAAWIANVIAFAMP